MAGKRVQNEPRTDGLQQKLAKARTSQQKAEAKVGKLRLRLEKAEAKLTKRAGRVDALQARTLPAEPPSTTAPKDQEPADVADDMHLTPIAAGAGHTQNGDHSGRAHKHGKGQKRH